jgi:hypothetical protein
MLWRVTARFYEKMWGPQFLFSEFGLVIIASDANDFLGQLYYGPHGLGSDRIQGGRARQCIDK